MGPDRYFHSGEIRLRYRDEGEGAAVVLVHGWTVDLEIWEPQSAELRRSMRVLRLDRRGFGMSSGDPDRDADADDIHALIDHLHLARAGCVGMSQGARAALSFALRYPRQVTSLVLDGPPNLASGTGSGTDDDISFDQLRALALRGGLDEFRRAWREHPLMKLRTEDPEAHTLLAATIARYPGRDLLSEAPKPAEPIETRTLARLRQPVLVVNGEFDTPGRRQAGEQLCRFLPRAERALVPDAGHLANLDNPRAYNGLIREFLRRRSRVAA
jgi:pimeloyl-ACP methyl ester carboxylesterase